jgi:ATP-dependent protease ClpP protease subunit
MPEGAPVDLRLNSPGGSVFDAVAIHNAIKRHEGTVTVWIDGIAASAASYIAMAGDEIVMPENAFLMIHDPAGLVMGTAEDMRAMAEALDKVKGSLVSGYAAKSGRTPEEVSALMAAETWFDASDAVAQGFADRLIEPVRIAANFDIGRFRNAPPVLVEAVEAESEPDDESDGVEIEADEDTDAAAEGDRSRTPRTSRLPLPTPLSRPPKPRHRAVRRPIPPRSGQRPSGMPGPWSISAASRASRRWPALPRKGREPRRGARRAPRRRPRQSPRSRRITRSLAVLGRAPLGRDRRPYLPLERMTP